jgi:hypothetical protein
MLMDWKSTVYLIVRAQKMNSTRQHVVTKPLLARGTNKSTEGLTLQVVGHGTGGMISTLPCGYLLAKGVHITFPEQWGVHIHHSRQVKDRNNTVYFRTMTNRGCPESREDYADALLGDKIKRPDSLGTSGNAV